MPLSKAAAAAAAKNPNTRPVVTVTTDTTTDPVLAHTAVCKTGECTWAYGPALKSDAEQHARWHRQDHRNRAAEQAAWERANPPRGGRP